MDFREDSRIFKNIQEFSKFIQKLGNDEILKVVRVTLISTKNEGEPPPDKLR